MRTLSSPLATALGAAVQQPALLVEIAFATVRRWSSFAAVTWNGQSWTKEAFSVEGLSVGALALSGTLVVENSDDVMGALVLSEGVQDRSIKVYGYDAAATATADVVLLADAIGGSAQISNRQVRVSLRSKAELTLAPRTFVSEATFGTLLPAGAVLRINGVEMRLARRS